NFLLRALALISKTDVNYKSAKNQRLLVEMALMQLCYMTAPNNDAEKKNNELNVFEEQSSVQKTPTNYSAPQQKTSAVQEPKEKIATKPTFTPEQLRSLVTNVGGVSVKKENLSQIVEKSSNSAVAEKAVAYDFVNKKVSEEEVKNAVLNYSKQKMQEGYRQIAVTIEQAEVKFADNLITLVIQN